VKAAVRDRYGPPEIVHVEEVSKPVPTGDQVLVRVRAASVNRADLDGLYPRWQFTRLFFGFRKPRARGIGLDIAGTVEAVGPDVTAFQPGDRVFSDLFAFGMGAFADYVVASERAFQTIPEGLGFEEAAALPHSALLALQGVRLRDGRGIRAGDRVLVVGASGNVGPFVVQMAKGRGAHVTGVARTEKLDFVRSLGADEVIDYTTTDYTRPAQPYDWIVDVDPHRSIAAFWPALRRGGTYLSMGGQTTWMLSSMVLTPLSRLLGRRMGLFLGWRPFHRDDVAELKGLIADGTVAPRIDRRFDLDHVVEALRWVDDGHAKGKVIVNVAPVPEAA
jgi:NADPH:quinone reductase-like Zn-dependent oxidoreductase